LRLRHALAAVPLALALAGCGSTGVNADADAGGGKELFQQKCGSCHALADAGTQGAVGPNLDAAFQQSLEDGMGQSTVREVTRAQMEYALPPMPQRDELDLSDAQADSIAAYVASVAGVEQKDGGGGSEAGGTEPEGKAIFAQSGCGSCHALADAGSSGTIGPDLDEAKPSLQLALERITNGKAPMPAFKGQLSDDEIQAVAKYVSTVAGT
jgi:cbb3-type cytochrome c oxidase subunit III